MRQTMGFGSEQIKVCRLPRQSAGLLEFSRDLEEEVEHLPADGLSAF